MTFWNFLKQTEKGGRQPAEPALLFVQACHSASPRCPSHSERDSLSFVNKGANRLPYL